MERKTAKIRAIPSWLVASTAAENTRDQEINAQQSEKNAKCSKTNHFAKLYRQKPGRRKRRKERIYRI